MGYLLYSQENKQKHITRTIFINVMTATIMGKKSIPTSKDHVFPDPLSRQGGGSMRWVCPLWRAFVGLQLLRGMKVPYVLLLEQAETAQPWSWIVYGLCMYYGLYMCNASKENKYD